MVSIYCNSSNILKGISSEDVLALAYLLCSCLYDISSLKYKWQNNVSVFLLQHSPTILVCIYPVQLVFSGVFTSKSFFFLQSSCFLHSLQSMALKQHLLDLRVGVTREGEAQSKGGLSEASFSPRKQNGATELLLVFTCSLCRFWAGFPWFPAEALSGYYVQELKGNSPLVSFCMVDRSVRGQESSSFNLAQVPHWVSGKQSSLPQLSSDHTEWYHMAHKKKNMW